MEINSTVSTITSPPKQPLSPPRSKLSNQRPKSRRKLKKILKLLKKPQKKERLKLLSHWREKNAEPNKLWFPNRSTIHPSVSTPASTWASPWLTVVYCIISVSGMSWGGTPANPPTPITKHPYPRIRNIALRIQRKQWKFDKYFKFIEITIWWINAWKVRISWSWNWIEVDQLG